MKQEVRGMNRAQQAGGITDAQFYIDPSFTNRTRNWFDVDWLLYNFRLPEDENVQVDKTKRKYTKRGTLTERMR